jgi:hypothetical protein
MVICLVVGGLTSCHDSATTPGAGPAARPTPAHVGGFIDDGTFGSLNSPNTGSYDGEIDPWDGNAPAKPIGSFHFPTIITVNTSGSVT